ncbi:MAG: hypothetical protein R2706_05450 [Acidimicrobiales bacterium]
MQLATWPIRAFQVINAAANGSLVRAMISFSLANEGTPDVASPSGNRLEGEPLWRSPDLEWQSQRHPRQRSGRDGTRCRSRRWGEEGDAVWLAEQGWSVTATDIAAARSRPGLPESPVVEG